MENRFLNCCFDYTLVSFRSGCNRLSCGGNHDPVINFIISEPIMNTVTV